MTAVERIPDPHALAQVEIGPMRRRHIGRVTKIEATVYPRPWSKALFFSELSQGRARRYLVARHRGMIVGYAGMMFMPGEAHVTNIAVDPDYHGLKVGSRLLLTLVTDAMARSSDILSLEVRVSNDPAQRMYEKFGFDKVGRRRGYYVETNEDAYVMSVKDALGTEYRLRLKAIREELDRLRDGVDDE